MVQKMMIDALVGDGLEVGLLQVLQGYWRAVGRLPKQTRIFFSISAAMYFWSAWKGEVVKVCVEVLTDECIEVWESLRLDP